VSLYLSAWCRLPLLYFQGLCNRRVHELQHPYSMTLSGFPSPHPPTCTACCSSPGSSQSRGSWGRRSDSGRTAAKAGHEGSTPLLIVCSLLQSRQSHIQYTMSMPMSNMRLQSLWCKSVYLISHVISYLSIMPHLAVLPVDRALGGVGVPWAGVLVAGGGGGLALALVPALVPVPAGQ
jgi:hypothetical protein